MISDRYCSAIAFTRRESVMIQYAQMTATNRNSRTAMPIWRRRFDGRTAALPRRLACNGRSALTGSGDIRELALQLLLLHPDRHVPRPHVCLHIFGSSALFPHYTNRATVYT